MKSNTKKLANLLMVDDSRPEVTLAKASLKRDKVHVLFSSVCCGTEALEYLRQENDFADVDQPDLVLLDLNMPNIPGLEILRAMQLDKNLPKIPVVVFSGSDAQQDIDDCKTLGAANYIVKPLSYDKLKDAITSIDCLVLDEEADQKYLRQKVA